MHCTPTSSVAYPFTEPLIHQYEGPPVSPSAHMSHEVKDCTHSLQYIPVAYTPAKCLVDGTEGLDLVPLTACQHPSRSAILVVIFTFQLHLMCVCVYILQEHTILYLPACP